MTGKRIQIISIFIVTILVGLPVWWSTTKVHRAPLPLQDVHDWSLRLKWSLFNQYNQVKSSEKVIQAGTAYRLSFGLAIADPESNYVVWDFPSLQKFYLQPLLDNLSVIADFSVGSQVFHYASLQYPPIWDHASSTFYIAEETISQFINPNDWKLDFSSNDEAQLNFVIFIPKKSESPLRIRQIDGLYAKTNSISIPQWGGIVIFNPPATNNSLVELNCDNLQYVMAIFISQLKELLGGFSTTELSSNEYSMLVQRHLYENLHTSAKTLLSLSKLIESLPNMIVLEHIQNLVQYSVNQLNEAHESLEKGDVICALRASRESLRASESAFFDPTMVGLLYFPDEHKYAIYTPFFLPVCFPIIAGIVKEYKRRKQKKEEQRTQGKEKRKNSGKRREEETDGGFNEEESKMNKE